MGVAFADDHRSCETGVYESEDTGDVQEGGDGVLTLRGSGDTHTGLIISIPFNRLTDCGLATTRGLGVGVE